MGLSSPAIAIYPFNVEIPYSGGMMLKLSVTARGR